MAFMGTLARLAGTIGGATIGGGTGLGMAIGSTLGGMGADLFEGDSKLSNTKEVIGSPSTWLPMTTPGIDWKTGELSPAEITTMGKSHGDDGEGLMAAVDSREEAARKKALMYHLMTLGGGGGMMQNTFNPNTAYGQGTK